MDLTKVSDYDLIEEARKRSILPVERCEQCGHELSLFFSGNGVLDSAGCYNKDCIYYEGY